MTSNNQSWIYKYWLFSRNLSFVLILGYYLYLICSDGFLYENQNRHILFNVFSISPVNFGMWQSLNTEYYVTCNVCYEFFYNFFQQFIKTEKTNFFLVKGFFRDQFIKYYAILIFKLLHIPKWTDEMSMTLDEICLFWFSYKNPFEQIKIQRLIFMKNKKIRICCLMS